MGIINSDLIPPAVLLDHPGITREEFAEFLGDIKVSMRGIDQGPPIYIDSTLYHLRLFSVAHHLNLREILDGTGESWEDAWQTISGKKFLREVRNGREITLEERLAELERTHDPKKIFDWNQKSGKLTAGLSFQEFRWLQESGRYYVDEEHARNHVFPVNDWQARRYTWNDLILTAEAIRTGYWEFIGRHGCADVFVNELLTKPGVIERYERATWDSHTSQYAKSRRMTNTELLRFRLSPH